MNGNSGFLGQKQWEISEKVDADSKQPDHVFSTSPTGAQRCNKQSILEQSYMFVIAEETENR